MTSTIESKSESADPQELEQAVTAVLAGISNCINFVATPTPNEEATEATPTSGGTESRDDDDEDEDEDVPPTRKPMSKEIKDTVRSKHGGGGYCRTFHNFKNLGLISM